MFAVALARHLDDLGLGRFDEVGMAGDVFVARGGRLPKNPGNLVSITPTGGIPQEAGGTLPWDEPTCQLLVRAACHHELDGLRRAQALYDALHGLHGLTMDEGGEDEVYVVRVLALQSGPLAVGADAEGRSLWSINVAALVRNSTVNRSLV